MTTATRHGDLQQRGRAQPTAKSRIGLIVALSMASGLIAAVVLVAMAFIPARECAHRCGAAGVCAGLGVAGRTVHPVHRPASTVGSCAGHVHGGGRPRFTQRVRGRAGGVQLGMAASPVRAGCLDVPSGPAGHAQPNRTVAAVPRTSRVDDCRRGRRLPDRTRIARRQGLPPPGQLIDVGGHRLHLYCTGSGSPTVVLEPGGGASSSDFAWIAPAVARDTRVCVYDRAGRGWSDAADGPQDGAHIAADLHTLLERAQVPGPYVLAGHSFGGLYVQSFAAQFPDQVAGMVLLDSTAPKPGPAQPTNTDPYNLIGRRRLVGRVRSPRGRTPAQPDLLHHSSATLPGRSPRQLLDRPTPCKLRRGVWSGEHVDAAGVGPDQPQRQAADRPHRRRGNTDDQWQSKQDHMATLSTNSLHRHANATHASLLDDEADAAVASKAIHDVVVAVRTSRPLAPLTAAWS